MNSLVPYVADLVAVTVLTFGLYWPRHRRRDLVVAFLGVNVGVLAVSGLLSGAAVTAGLGLGLFGVLSIIRLRSDELAQHEIAYYFAALALGLLGGLSDGTGWLPVALMALVVATLAVADHPALLGDHRREVVVLDRAHTDEDEVRSRLEGVLGGRVTSLTVLRLNLVDDTTTVDVRYRVNDSTCASNASHELVGALR